jgi:hypothetical protein
MRLDRPRRHQWRRKRSRRRIGRRIRRMILTASRHENRRESYQPHTETAKSHFASCHSFFSARGIRLPAVDNVLCLRLPSRGPATIDILAIKGIRPWQPTKKT